MTTIVVYINMGNAQVLKAENHSLIKEFGLNWMHWPYDLGLYQKEPGIWIWEGEIPAIWDGDLWEGEWRRLNEAEIREIVGC